MILRRDRDFAHPSPYGAGGIAHGCAEQLGESNDGHGPMSADAVITIRSSIPASAARSRQECVAEQSARAISGASIDQGACAISGRARARRRAARAAT